MWRILAGSVVGMALVGAFARGIIPVPEPGVWVTEARAQDPEPGERQEYPDGQFCSPKGDIIGGFQTLDHPCHCHRVDYDEFCEGTPTHDQVCQQYCSERHCACPITCDPQTHGAGKGEPCP